MNLIFTSVAVCDQQQASPIHSWVTPLLGPLGGLTCHHGAQLGHLATPWGTGGEWLEPGCAQVLLEAHVVLGVEHGATLAGREAVAWRRVLSELD